MPPKRTSTAGTAASTKGRATRRGATKTAETAPSKSKKASEPNEPSTPPAKRRRTTSTLETNNPKETAAAATKRAGRRSKGEKATPVTQTAPESAVFDEKEDLPRKRGEPPFGGETIKDTSDAVAAAEQLESELLDSAKKPRAKKKTAAAAAASTSGPGERQYWLMKAEQEDRFETAKNGTVNNTKFTIDDLRERKVPEPWDGVRNAVAANHMRAMRVGDLAFFYASGGKQGRTPGITGIMEVVSTAEPDPSVRDEGSYGYVEKATDRDRWIMVRVAFRHKLKEPVSLKALQGHRDGRLANMQLLKQMRLSVSRVEPEEWDFIIKDMLAAEDLGKYAT